MPLSRPLEGVAQLEPKEPVHKEERHGGRAEHGVRGAGLSGLVAREELGEERLREEQRDADGARHGVGGLEDGLVLRAEEHKAPLPAKEEEEEGQPHQRGVELARGLARERGLACSCYGVVCVRDCGMGVSLGQCVIYMPKASQRTVAAADLVAEVGTKRSHGGQHDALICVWVNVGKVKGGSQSDDMWHKSHMLTYHVGAVEPFKQRRRDVVGLHDGTDRGGEDVRVALEGLHHTHLHYVLRAAHGATGRQGQARCMVWCGVGRSVE